MCGVLTCHSVKATSLLPFEARRLNSGSSGSRMWQQVPLPTAPSLQHKFITWAVSTKSSPPFFCKIFIFVSVRVYVNVCHKCVSEEARKGTLEL